MTVHIPLDTEENIVGNTVETSESKKSEKYSIRSSILSHELWHIYDFTHGDGNYPLTLCSNDQFDYLYNNYSADVNTNNEYVDDYFADEENSRAEFFAECGDMYVNKLQTLQKDTPEIYDFFETLSKE